MIGFSHGFFVVISTHMKEIGQVRMLVLPYFLATWNNFRGDDFENAHFES